MNLIALLKPSWKNGFSTLDPWNWKIPFAVWPTQLHHKDKPFSLLSQTHVLTHTTFSTILQFSWSWLIFNEFYFWNFTITFSPPLSNRISIQFHDHPPPNPQICVFHRFLFAQKLTLSEIFAFLVFAKFCQIFFWCY